MRRKLKTNRSLYESSQSKKYESTLREISDALVKEYPRSGQISSYKEFAKTLKEGTTKQKEEQKGKLPLPGTYDTAKGDDIQRSTKRDAEEHLLTREVLAGYNYRGLVVSEREYAMVRAALMRKNADLNRLKPIVGVFAHDFYYICVNHAWGDFTIIYKTSPEIEQDLIEFSIEVLNDEESFTDDEGSVGFLEDFQKRRSNRRRRRNLPASDLKDGRNERKVDEVINRDGRRTDKQGSVSFSVGDIGNNDSKIDPLNIRDIVSMAQKAEKHFGITNDVRESGYITVSGKMLDFSGRHWGGINKGSRQVDHEDVTEILPEDFDTFSVSKKGDVNRIGVAKYEFLKYGSVRTQPETGSVELAMMPTDEQKTALVRFLKEMRALGNDILRVDIDGIDKNGKLIPVASLKYDRGTSIDMIILDIEEYYNRGKLPEGVKEFPKSLQDSWRLSTKRDPSISEDASNYILNTKEYQEIIDIVNQRYNLTNQKTLSQKAIDRLAGSLLTKAKSKYDKGALTERLSALLIIWQIRKSFLGKM